ncbi:MAG: cobalamin-independent methionine synthase II family protein [Deltaproteobacteria bacterium]|nr:cobalamin-independent methionine synthase II family protein [Deltaproteobacteria bacterium]
MERGTRRILTTHTGSLPRPKELIGLMIEEQAGRLRNRTALDDLVRRCVAEVVKKQADVGLDIINDGEQGRVDYTVYIKDRLTGFEGESLPPTAVGSQEFPELAALLTQFASPFQTRPACTGPVTWKDWPAVEADLNNLKAAIQGIQAEEVFMTSPSPGQIARFLRNRYYPNDEAYLYALADVMKRQYQAIVNAGFLLQLDCPDLTISRTTIFAHLTLEEFRKVAEMHIEALNYAVAGIPPERLRMHICWGSTTGPHHRDVPLKDIVDILLKGGPAGLAFPGANPRHEHEWKIWKEVKLPEGKFIIPGIIYSTSNFVGHQELVADRIVRYANVVGRTNMIAGVDCGFGTFAGRVQVDSKIVWLKLQSLVEGARLASETLW